MNPKIEKKEFSSVDALNRLIDNNELFYDEMTLLMRKIMSGQVAPELIAAILIGLRIKVETVSEITAAVNVLREFMLPVDVKDKSNLIDIVGTGGDGAHTFNISTTAMFVAAAMGARVAKHGGRAVSSKCGAADIIETMGASLKLTPEQIAQSFDDINIGFMYAPAHHSAMKYVAPVRKILGVRTFFNILGPLTNPASAPNQVLGVFHPDLVGICANVGKSLNMKHLMVVNGADGLDEITIGDKSYIGELINGEILRYEITPEEFGMERIDGLNPIRAESPQESLQKMDAVLAGAPGPCRDIVLLNAAAVLYCVGLASDLSEGVAMAKEGIDSGKARAKKAEFIEYTSKIAANNSKA